MSHWQATNCILHHLKSIIHMSIHYSADALILFPGFFYTNWVGDLEGRQSTSRYLLTQGLGRVS